MGRSALRASAGRIAPAVPRRAFGGGSLQACRKPPVLRCDACRDGAVAAAPCVRTGQVPAQSGLNGPRAPPRIRWRSQAMRMNEIAQRPARSGLRRARRQLLEDGELPRELVGPELARSWLRSWQAGLQPAGRMPG